MRRVLLTLTLAAGLVGCGGDDQLSVSEYRTELRRICADSDKQLERVTEPTRASPEAIVSYLSRLRDINTSSIERVEKLNPPDDLKGAHDRALKANREGREKLGDVISQLEKGGDPTKVLTEARTALQPSSDAAKQAARDLGVPQCGD